MSLGLVPGHMRRTLLGERHSRRVILLWRGRTLAVPIPLSMARTTDGANDNPAPARSDPLSADCDDFIQRHQRDILNYLWRMTGDEQTAYDLTQEVFLRAWQHFDTLRTYEQPRSWLFRVATNLALTHLRRHAPRTSTLDALDPQRHPAMSDPAWRLAERDQVHQTLLQLAPQRRAALVLREVYGLSAAEVGRLLDISETAVRMTLHRARKQFRAIYTREEGTSDGE